MLHCRKGQYATAYRPFSVMESCTSNANPPSSERDFRRPLLLWVLRVEFLFVVVRIGWFWAVRVWIEGVLKCCFEGSEIKIFVFQFVGVFCRIFCCLGVDGF